MRGYGPRGPWEAEGSGAGSIDRCAPRLVPKKRLGASGRPRPGAEFLMGRSMSEAKAGPEREAEGAPGGDRPSRDRIPAGLDVSAA